MKEISIQALKRNLSAAIAEAENGAAIIITRHNEPVAQLTAVRSAHVHRGATVGATGLRPALKRGTKIRYLEILSEDRGNR